ncbi:MAG: DUF302 domain-containing protein [Acidimicrobiia bacterium]|nr:DUF302 domain-containing protein [Acidimicrobiia bacterium]
MSTYTFGVVVDRDFDAVVDEVTAALQVEGFGVLTEIDVQATMKAKLDHDMAPYRILGACNPPLAHRAISAEAEIGALLPCNVVVRVADDGVAVDFMDPAAVMSLVDREGIADIAADVRAKMQRVAAAIV